MATGGAPDEPLPRAGHLLEVAAERRPRKLSDEFALILREFEVETVTLREVMLMLHGRGYVLLVMLLALPFSLPVSLPGLSTPFGLIIALIGVRLVFGAKPWLPGRLLDMRLSPPVFARVFATARRIVLWFEKFLRPRMLWTTATPRREQAHAVPIVLCALMLLLPVPVPFSNVLPAWGVLLVAGGLLERDGVFIVAGYVTALAALAFFGVIGLLGREAVDAIWQWFGMRD
jgi:hypothetical protein